MIPDAVIDEIRSRVDIVAVIGRHMELKKSGRTWKGCCVFHGERTASFHVYPEDRHFKCYGCGEYGDVFKFLQKLQGREFPEIVRALASEVGVDIPEREEDSAEQRRRRQERAEVLSACAAAARYFAARLASAHGEPGRAYLASRGLTDETVQRFRLGLASTAWDDLTARLAPKGVAEGALEKAGLVAHREGGGRYDRFRARLMIPIAGLDGEAIGFGGRVLPGASDKLAKYINSPESVLYKKSKVLYGIDLAREHIRRTRQAILVEGYFDVIGLHQAGVKNAVAVCGTALTPEHVDLLKRCDCREVVLLFDGDPAGQAAPARAAQALLPSGVTGKVALLPTDGGKVDPDEFARSRGASALEALVAAAPPLTEFLLERAVRAHCGDAPASAPMESKLAAFRELKPFLALVPAGLARTFFEERVAKRLDVAPAALAAEVDATPATGEPPPRPRHLTPPEPAPAPAARPAGSRRALWGPAVDALGLLASFPQLADLAREELLPALFEGGPLEPLVRDLLDGAVPAEALPERLAPHLDEKAVAHVRDLLGPARPATEAAERALRQAILRARLAALEQEHDRLTAAVTRAGTPAPEELASQQIATWRRLAGLKKRLQGLERG
jgi:DNA primase